MTSISMPMRQRTPRASPATVAERSLAVCGSIHARSSSVACESGLLATLDCKEHIAGARSTKREVLDRDAGQSFARERLSEQIILLGDSRMQCDMAPEVLGAALASGTGVATGLSAAPRRSPTLRHIAEESDFSGSRALQCHSLFFLSITPFFSGGRSANLYRRMESAGKSRGSSISPNLLRNRKRGLSPT